VSEPVSARALRAWGLPRERLIVIENGQAAAAVAAAVAREESPAELCRRFAYFGQISEFKGIQVYLDAVEQLPPALRRRADFEIHGALQPHSEVMKQQFAERLAEMRESVSFRGAYGPDDLPALMRSVGWVVVPSIWWENSPLVIQEAFANRRPVICSNIGGMAEKVADGKDGLHFRAGDARDLARRLAQACNPRLWSSLRAGIAPPPSIADTTSQHLDLYAGIAERRSGNRFAADRRSADVVHLPIKAPLAPARSKRGRRTASPG
jgi:glycosyltransferase involved in cell wall biosynthesis